MLYNVCRPGQLHTEPLREEHAKLMTDKWHYSEGDKTTELFKFYYKHLPSVGIFDSDNKCVAFVPTRIDNCIGLGYISPEWRAHQLSIHLMNELYKVLKQQGYWPCISYADMEYILYMSEKLIADRSPGLVIMVRYTPNSC